MTPLSPVDEFLERNNHPILDRITLWVYRERKDAVSIYLSGKHASVNNIKGTRCENPQEIEALAEEAKQFIIEQITRALEDERKGESNGT